MAMRKMHRAHRHTGRMTRDPSQRMSNKAEVGFGLVGFGIILLFVLGIVGLIL
jgi:hypothetical protein